MTFPTGTGFGVTCSVIGHASLELRSTIRTPVTTFTSDSGSNEASDEASINAIPSALTDLTDIDLTKIPALDSAVLADALKRIRDEIEHPEEAVAGFQSSL